MEIFFANEGMLQTREGLTERSALFIYTERDLDFPNVQEKLTYEPTISP